MDIPVFVVGREAAPSMPSDPRVVKRRALRHSLALCLTSSIMQNQALRADLLMLLTALIWGSAFVAQRLGMEHVGPFLYTGLRFALAALVLVPLLTYSAAKQRIPGEPCSTRGRLFGG